MRKVLIASFLLFQTFLLQAQQELYMPLEIQKAYKKNTRSLVGRPGVNYWQNFSTYDIEAEIEPGLWKITGKETVTYINNSPDSLKSIIIKMYPNHYKKGGARANTVPLEDLTDGMVLSEIIINNALIDLSKSSNVVAYSTFIKIFLDTPIPPKKSIQISMNWSTNIPPVYVNRIGAYDQESAFMGYWYPQIGVYDDIDGWDEYEYLGSQEFYRDFADFNVKITVPAAYSVWGTGTLQNPEGVLSKEEYMRFKLAQNTDEPVVIYSGEKSESTKNVRKSWIFKARNVQDFAAGISNNFRWEASSVQINNKSISSNLVYDIQSKGTQKMLLKSQNDGLYFLSKLMPAMEFPYDHFTTFVGVTEFDGMEFPMIANNGFGSNEAEDVEVTFHELAHTYFPFYVGINEVKYSWMEEGWAAFFTIKFIQEYFKGTEHENAELNRVLNQYNNYAGHHWESPLIAPTNHLVYRPGHVQLSYKKPAFMYLTLQDLLGEELFLECLKEYMQRWAGKHPTPYDFMFTFNEVSKQNLNWFWQAWIFDYGYADLAISELRVSKVYIENIGRLPMPINLKVVYEGGKEIILHETAEIWVENKKVAAIPIQNSSHVNSIELLSTEFPDVNKSNNFLQLK